MWACALGHTEAALMLYQWDPRALAIPDSLGRLPLNIARSRGHTRLAELLEQLQQSPQAQSQLTETWMERWRGESQTNGTNNNSTANLSSGWFYHQGGFICQGTRFSCNWCMFSTHTLRCFTFVKMLLSSQN